MALNLGMSVDECQDKISSSEFGEWIAYESISPTNPEREDLRTALLCYHMTRLLADTKGQDVQITDYLLDFSEKEIRTDEQKRERSRDFWRSIANG